MWKSHQHDDLFGPKAAAYRNAKSEEAGSMDQPTSNEAMATRIPNAAPISNGNVVASEERVVEPVRSGPVP